MPHPRIHSLRYGSPAPSGAPRWVAAIVASGQVSRIAAPAYTAAATAARAMRLSYRLLQQLGDEPRIGLATRGLHDLPHQELQLAILAVPNLGNHLGVAVDDGPDVRLDGGGIR